MGDPLEPAKVCPLCQAAYADWALHIDEALGSCCEIDRLPPEEYFGELWLRSED